MDGDWASPGFPRNVTDAKETQTDHAFPGCLIPEHSRSLGDLHADARCGRCGEPRCQVVNSAAHARTGKCMYVMGSANDMEDGVQ